MNHDWSVGHIREAAVVWHSHIFWKILAGVVVFGNIYCFGWNLSLERYMNHKHSFPKNKTFQPQRFVFRSPWIRKWLFSPSRFFPKSSFLRPKMAPGVEKLGPLKSLHCSWLRIPGLDPHFQNPSSAGFGFFGFKKKRFALFFLRIEAKKWKLPQEN